MIADSHNNKLKFVVLCTTTTLKSAFLINVSLPPTPHTNLDVGRGRIATCFSLRESCRGLNPQRQVRPYLVAPLPRTVHGDRRSNFVHKTLRCPTVVHDQRD